MNALVSMIIQLIAGAVGGNVAGMWKKINMGPVGNTIAGAIGGIGLNQILPWLWNQPAGGTLMEIIVSLIGGMILTAIAGMVRHMMMKK